MAYHIDETSKRVLDETRRKADEAARILSENGSYAPPSQQQGNSGKLIGLAIITAAGADADHWQWKFALRDHTDGTWMAGNYGYTAMGECVIADAGSAAVGDNGLLYYQQNDDSGVVITFVPIAQTEGFWAYVGGSTPTLITGYENRWQYGWTEYEETATGWQLKSGGRSGTPSTNYALNSVEALNTSGVGGATIGNIGPAAIVPNSGYFINLKPVKCIVWMRVGKDTSGNTTYRFEMANAAPVSFDQIPLWRLNGAGVNPLTAEWREYYFQLPVWTVSGNSTPVATSYEATPVVDAGTGNYELSDTT
jgi:hypothetical protein